jgi:hypothetical protein
LAATQLPAEATAVAATGRVVSDGEDLAPKTAAHHRDFVIADTGQCARSPTRG